MPCIRCGDCATACPENLQPQQLLWDLRAGKLLHAREHGLLECSECGNCDSACPSRIPLLRNFRDAMTAHPRARCAVDRGECGARALRTSPGAARARGRRTRRARCRHDAASRLDRCRGCRHRPREGQAAATAESDMNPSLPSATSLQPSARSVPRIMGLVLLALLPAALARIAFVGADAAWHLLLAMPVALGFEAVMLKLRTAAPAPVPGRPERALVRRAARAAASAADALVDARGWIVRGHRSGQACLRRTRRKPVQSGDGRLRGAVDLLSVELRRQRGQRPVDGQAARHGSPGCTRSAAFS